MYDCHRRLGQHHIRSKATHQPHYRRQHRRHGRRHHRHRRRDHRRPRGRHLLTMNLGRRQHERGKKNSLYCLALAPI